MWRWAARVVALAIAVAVAAAGVLVIAPHTVSLGFAIPQHLPLLGCFLIYSAVLIAVSAALGSLDSRIWLVDLALTAVFGRIALLATGLITAVLVFEGLRAGHWWFAGLLLAPAGGLLSLAKRPPVIYPEASAGEIGLTPDAGQYATMGEILRAAFYTAIGAIPTVLPLLWALFGIAVFKTLNAELFQAVPVSLLDSARAVVGGSPGLLILAAVPSTLGVVVVLVNGIGQRLKMMLVPGSNRLLSLREMGFIEDCFEATAEYADRANYPEATAPEKRATTASYLLFIAMGAALFFWMEKLPSLLPDPDRIWYAATDYRYAQMLFLGCCITVAISGIPQSAMSLVWPRYAEAVGWRRLVDDSGWGGLTERILLLARLHRLPTPFDPVRFLRRQGRRVAVFWLALIALGAAATAFASIHDRSAAELARPGGIDVTDYWTLKTTHYGYAQIGRAEYRCTFDKDHDAGFHIYLLLPDRELDWSHGKLSAAEITGLAAMDGELRRLKTPVYFSVNAKNRSLYDPACVRALSNDPRVARIFHLDDWQKRR